MQFFLYKRRLHETPNQYKSRNHMDNVSQITLQIVAFYNAQFPCTLALFFSPVVSFLDATKPYLVESVGQKFR